MKKKLKTLVEDYNCILHISPFGNQLRASYAYAWYPDVTFRFSLLSEVAECLQEPFKAILRDKGLRQSGVRETEDKPYVQDLLEPDPDTPAGRRWEALMPEMIPRYLRVYDCGPDSAFDRYTAVFTGRRAKESAGGEYPYVGMSERPYHPQGFGQHGSNSHRPCDVSEGGWPPAMGRKNHLGTRIGFLDLPPDCQKLALSDYLEIHGL